MFKKITILITLSIISCSIISTPVFAQYGLQESARKTPYNNTTDFYSIVEQIISGALGVLAFIFFGLALYAGVRWMTARGDEGFVEKAKDTLRAAVIGLVIVLSAYALTRFVFERLSTTTSEPTSSISTPAT